DGARVAPQRRSGSRERRSDSSPALVTRRPWRLRLLHRAARHGPARGEGPMKHLPFALALLAAGCARSPGGDTRPDPPVQFDTSNPAAAPPNQLDTDSLPIATPGQKGCGCTGDYRALTDCNGNGIARCVGLEGCDPESFTCENACEGTKKNRQSVGCE